jgi:hypothetical protein
LSKAFDAEREAFRLEGVGPSEGDRQLIRVEVLQQLFVVLDEVHL